MHVLLYLLSIYFVIYVECVSVEKDLTLSSAERKALDVFKQEMIHKLPHDYMTKDIYLINWIRAAQLDLNTAERMLLDNLKWRKENKIDELIAQDFSFFEEEYPIDISGVDKTGRPVIAVDIGNWDMRKIIVTGLQPKSYAFSMRALEIASQKVRDAQARGEAVTRFQVIFNLYGYSIQQHGCARCLNSYISFISAFQKYYPGMTDNIVFINAPSLFYNALRALRNISGPTLRGIVKLYGTDKREWKKFLSIIPADQLDRSMGGTRISDL